MNIATYMDPRFMNYIIMGLYFCNALWYAYLLKYPDMCYWLSALGITASVTWGYNH